MEMFMECSSDRVTIKHMIILVPWTSIKIQFTYSIHILDFQG